MEGDFFNPFQMLTNYISIHSLRMEGDKYVSSDAFSASHISIHSLRMEGDFTLTCRCTGVGVFQSTPSAWRETDRFGCHAAGLSISIHSLRMEGDMSESKRSRHWGISIHSLRMEGDPASLHFTVGLEDFNPLPPHGGRRFPLSGSDCWLYFNPLPPHGGRLPYFRRKLWERVFQSTPSAWRETSSTVSKIRHCTFQSTPSAWRETFGMLRTNWRIFISIHSLRMEGDNLDVPKAVFHNISIHSLRMEGDNINYNLVPDFHISIHSLRMEGDCSFHDFQLASGTFQSTPSAWRETGGRCNMGRHSEFQSTPSAWRETGV